MDAITVRELPPLRLGINVQTPTGANTRWGWDDPNPIFAPSSMTFSSTMPGGFERLSLTLERESRLSYADTVRLFENITVSGLGGTTAWEGRVEKTPDTGGFQQGETVEAVGWQAHLEDNKAVREIYVDRELSKWEAASIARKIALNKAGIDEEDASVGTSSGTTGTTQPAVINQIVGAWERARESDAWYNAFGIPIGLLKYAWKLTEAGKIGTSPWTDTNWVWSAILSTDEIATSYEPAGSLRAEGPTGSGTVTATALRTFAATILYYGAPAGTDGITYPLYWPVLAVYGTHGLPLYGGLTLEEAPGVHAADVVAHAVQTWAPKLAFTQAGPEATIQPSSVVIPQLVFTTPTTVSEIIKQATRFELQDWAVWENRTFYMNERSSRGNSWRARVGPAQLQQAGPQAARLWNGVVVAYTDVTGIARTVGPAGSRTEREFASLEDPNPENPLNQEGVKKWALLQMGTSTPAGAEKVGAIFLREQKKLETSGQATLVGHVEDTAGTLWPAWKVRAGDNISFVDAADSSPRRVVSASYDDSSKTCQVQLDQPPDTLQAILERLSASIQPFGFS